MRLMFDFIDLEDCTPQRGWTSSNSLKVWVEEKQSRETFTFSNCFHAGILSFSCLYTLNCVWNYTSAILVLRLSDSDWNYTIGSPGCLPCQLQTLRLFSLHNHVSQFFIIKLFIYTFYFLEDPSLFNKEYSTL